MAITRDGLSKPLPPNPIQLLIGAAITVGGVALVVMGNWLAGVLLVPLGALWLVNQKGVTRVRVTHSKLLIEDERLIWGFVIGPRRSRVMWEELQEHKVDGGAVLLTTTKGPVRIAEGAPPDELSALNDKIGAMLQRQ